MQENVILATLREQFEDAKERHRCAKEHFWEVAGRPRHLPRIPTGLRHPDDSDVIRKAVAEEAQARRAHIDALVRLNQFLISGIIPDDLQQARQQSEPAGKPLALKKAASPGY